MRPSPRTQQAPPAPPPSLRVRPRRCECRHTPASASARRCEALPSQPAPGWQSREPWPCPLIRTPTQATPMVDCAAEPPPRGRRPADREDGSWQARPRRLGCHEMEWHILAQRPAAPEQADWAWPPGPSSGDRPASLACYWHCAHDPSDEMLVQVRSAITPPRYAPLRRHDLIEVELLHQE